MHSATIPLAALTTFAAVYWLTPAPAQVAEVEPEPVMEAAAPASGGVGPSLRTAVPATRAVERPRVRPARKSRARIVRSKVASSDVVRPVRPVRRIPETRVYFSGCNEVRAAGLAPLYRGQPGYRPEMDGDDDGVACEPYRGSRR